MTEFYDLGAHCSIPHCNAKDFLPFTCDLCHATFCLEHRSYNDHRCPTYFSQQQQQQQQQNQKATTKATTATSKKQPTTSGVKKAPLICHLSNCHNKGVIKCKFCHEVHCISHRLDIDHNCPRTKTNKKSSASASASSSVNDLYTNMNEKLARLHEKSQQRKEKQQKMEIKRALDRGDYHLQSKLLQKSFVNKKTQPIIPNNGSNSGTSNNNNSASIDYENQFPLDVYFPIKSQSRPVHMLFHRNWKLGRVLDMVAQYGKVENRNHVTLDAEKRLYLFNLMSTECLEVSKTLDELRLEGALMPNDGIILEYGPVLNPEITAAFQAAVQNPNEAASSCTVM